MNGKSGKDRVIPLAASIAQKLQNFTRGNKPMKRYSGLRQLLPKG